MQRAVPSRLIVLFEFALHQDLALPQSGLASGKEAIDLQILIQYTTSKKVVAAKE